MDTAHQDTAQLAPALEQALDPHPSAAIPTLIVGTDRWKEGVVRTKDEVA